MFHYTKRDTEREREREREKTIAEVEPHFFSSRLANKAFV